MSGRAVLTATATALGLLVPAATAAAGTTLYVDRSNAACSDTGAGTATQPFCTIKAAAARANAGTTVQVAAGTYTGTVSVAASGTSTAPIVLTAAPGARVTVTGSGDGFSVSSKSWITINGFAVTDTAGYGINVVSSSNITISANHVSDAGVPVQGEIKAGIRLSGTTGSLVSNNVSDHNSDYGILVTNGSDRNEIRGNQTFNNARTYERATAGIRIYQSTGNVVDRNVSHDNEDSGIECYPGANDTLLYDNVVYRNGDHGLDNYGATGQRIIGNTVYMNVTAGINVEGSSTGATVRNNISVDNGIKSPRTHSNIRIERGSTAGTTVDSDVVSLSTPDTMMIWDSVSYSSLAAFQAASGQESHGIQADPLWRDRAAGDFHLLGGSPAIDSADSGVSGQPNTDVEGNARRDDPGTPNTGLGPRSYDDRGAYEFQGTSPPKDDPPVALLSVSPGSGSAPLAVTADASSSSDTDSTPIASYFFDFGDGSAAVGPQPGATATHTYGAAGSFAVTVTVTDTAGNSSRATAQVDVGAAPGTNLVGNPGFETSLAGWNTSGFGSPLSLARVAGGHSGSWAAVVSNTGTSATTCGINDSPNWVAKTYAGTYTASLWVRADTAGATLRLRLREYSGTTLVGSASSAVTLTTNWQQVVVAYQVAAPGSTLDFNAYISSASPGACFAADDASITLG